MDLSLKALGLESLPEPIWIVSDLHLGHPACAIDSPEELRPLFEGVGTVIFNGDTAESRSRNHREKASEGREKFEKVLDQAAVERRIFLTGNHDPTVSQRHHLDLCEGRLLVTHGDFLYRYVSPWSKKLRHCRPRIDAILKETDDARILRDFDYRLEVTRRCCEVLEVANHRFSLTPWGFVRFLHGEFWPPTRLLTILTVWKRAPEMMAEALERYRPEAEAVVFGHIHYPGVWKRRGRVIINTGAWLSMTGARVVEVRGNEVSVRAARRRRRRSESEWTVEAGGERLELGRATVE